MWTTCRLKIRISNDERYVINMIKLRQGVILLSVCTGEKLFLTWCRRQSEKREVRDTVINKLHTQQHKGTTKTLSIVPRSKNKKRTMWPIALIHLPGIPLCIVCVRCLCNFALVLTLYILLSLALRGSGRTFLISRSGWSNSRSFFVKPLSRREKIAIYTYLRHFLSVQYCSLDQRYLSEAAVRFQSTPHDSQLHVVFLISVRWVCPKVDHSNPSCIRVSLILSLVCPEFST